MANETGSTQMYAKTTGHQARYNGHTQHLATKGTKAVVRKTSLRKALRILATSQWNYSF